MLLDHVVPEQWYTVRDAVKLIGWEVDSIRRFISEGHLQAQLRPGRIGRRKRDYKALRIQGCEIIRFVRENMTVLKPDKRLRLRMA
jgi:hypothetical protein